ncbi:MAG: sugar phosphate isomerase/epimerase [Bryobacterales bacterium]|nr:sugar phosphate isomerase/epimerase [Bryobacterales bacterium]
MANFNRRAFLAASALAAGTPAPAMQKRLPIQKAVLLGMLPKNLSIRDKFQLAKDCGFEQMEAGTEPDAAVSAEIRKAAEQTGVRVHSVMNSDHWRFPVSSADPEVVAKSMKGMETSLRNAAEWGAETVLLVPAVVDAKTRYQDAWTRSVTQIKKLIPMAEKLKVVIAIEEVWNKFLLSPMEFARYVDDFKSPWVKAYFDVGNVVLYGYPQDWIRTLGKRIVKLHFKDFQFKNDPSIRKRVADFVNLRDGEIDWKEIHAALTEIGYKGTATVELAGGDAAYLKDVSRRFDLILEGA